MAEDTKIPAHYRHLAGADVVRSGGRRPEPGVPTETRPREHEVLLRLAKGRSCASWGCVTGSRRWP